MRNGLAKVSKGHDEMVAATIRTIFAQPGQKEVRAQVTERGLASKSDLDKLEARIARLFGAAAKPAKAAAGKVARPAKKAPAKKKAAAKKAPAKKAPAKKKAAAKKAPARKAPAKKRA